MSGTILSMPTEQIVALLIAERDKLNRAIEVLQGPTKQRGRPPKNRWTFSTPLGTQVLSEPKSAPKPRRRTFVAAQPRQQAQRMKAFGSAKKKAAAKRQSTAASKPKKTAKVA
jgi:hypothetical protein